MNKKLLLILLIASFLRLFRLGEVPASLYIDEIAIGVDAKSIAQTGKDMHGNSLFSEMFPSYGDYKLPVYILAASATTKVFGSSEFAVRLPSALAGIVSVYLVYLLTKELFKKHSENEKYALLSSLITAVMPWSVLFSRTGFEGHLGQSILLFAVYVSFIAHKRPWMFLFAGFLGALSVYTYYSVRFVFPVVFIAAFVLMVSKKHVKKRIPWMLGGLVVFALLLTPLFTSKYYEPSNQFRLSTKNVMTNEEHILRANDLREADGNTLFSRIVHHRSAYMLKDLAKNYASHLNLSYLFIRGDENLRHSTGTTGIMLMSFVPIFLAGVYTFGKRYSKIGLFLLVWYIAALLPASVPYEVPHALRSINGLGVLGIVCGVGAVELLLWLRRKARFGLIVSLLYGLIVSVNIGVMYLDYFSLYPERSANAWAQGRTEMGKFVAKQSGDAGRIQVVGDEKLSLWILFYGNFDFHEIQQIPADKYVRTTFENIEIVPGLSLVNEQEENLIIVGRTTLMDEVSGSIPLGKWDDESFSYREAFKL